MSDEIRTPARLTVRSRPARDIEAYGGGGDAPRPGEEAATNVLAAVWRRKGVVLACVAVAMAAGAIYLSRAAKVYSSSAVMLVQQSNPSQFFAREMGSVNNTSASFLFTQCQLITSTAMLTQAVDVPGVADVPLLKRMENPAGYLKATVSAVPSKLGDTLVVSMESPDFQSAPVIVNGVVQAYQDYQSQQHQSNSVKLAGILQREVDSREKDLRAAQEAMRKLRREHPDLGFNSDKGDSSLLSTLNGELTTAEITADNLKSATATVTATDPADVSALRGLVDRYGLGGQLPPTADVRPAAQAYADLQAKLQVMQDAGLLPGSETVRRTELAAGRAAAELDRASRAASAACVSTVKAASDLAEARVKQLRAKIAEERRTTAGLNVFEAEYAELTQQTARNDRAIDAINDQLKRLVNIEDVPPMTVTVLETAKADPRPVRPVPSKTMGMALVGGLMAGLGLAVLLEKVDQRLRSVEEVIALLDTPVLGVVPRVLRRVLPGEIGREIQLRPRSGVAEAFRTVRTAIYFGGAGGGGGFAAAGANGVGVGSGKTILVTSPTPGDGKSTTISNLAIAVAQGGRRTLLIDADCRRPVQHKTFGLGGGAEDNVGPGLSGVLSGRATLDQAVRPTDVDRLDLLPCGPLPHNPAELLDSQPLLDLLAEVARRYDQVLIDSPPVTLVSDARILAASCDAAILVVRHDRSTRRGAQLAWNALVSVGANVLGVVINDLTRRKDGYGYSYYGYGRYGYAPAAPTAGELPHSGNGVASGNGQAVASRLVE